MSQVAPTQSAPAPPAAGAAQPDAPDRDQQEPSVRDTPKLLNQWQLIGVVAVVAFGLLAALVQFLSWQSDGRAADDTEQLVRVQEIQSTLLRADALATNAFLVGGNEGGDQQAAYDEAMASVFALIAEAADAQPADREALSALNVRVNDYATAVAEARVNNRQGYPIGAQYLSGASDALRSDALPVLSNLVDANTERAEDSMSGQHPWWLLLIGILTLVVLVWVNLQLSHAFRRRINVGVAVAAVIVLLTTLVSAAAAYRGGSQNDGLLDDELRSAIDQAAVRTAANDAKAQESLRLIQRGSGDLHEDPWKEAAAVVDDLTDPDLRGDWDAYTERHEALVELDAGDRWVAARDVAIGQGSEGTTGPFDAFDEASATLVDEMAAETTDTLRAGRTLAFAGVLLTLLLGMASGVAVSRGIAERRREYA